MHRKVKQNVMQDLDTTVYKLPAPLSTFSVQLVLKLSLHNKIKLHKNFPGVWLIFFSW